MPYDPDRTIGLNVCRTGDTRLSFIARNFREVVADLAPARKGTHKVNCWSSHRR